MIGTCYVYWVYGKLQRKWVKLRYDLKYRVEKMGEKNFLAYVEKNLHSKHLILGNKHPLPMPVIWLGEINTTMK